MENKYYTPDISEFHAGFEFLSKVDYCEWIKREPTLEYIWSVLAEIDNCPEAINDFLVKYLDKNDIEDSDFEWDKQNNPSPCFYQLYHYKHSVDNLPGGYKVYDCVLHHCVDLNRVKIEFKIEGEWEKMFEGTIKNKSKLREVMEIVGIKNE